MNKLYIFSDPHFYHNNIIGYENRPFCTMKEMNKTLINNYNAIIQKHDKVWILGDFSFGVAEQTRKLITDLNGYKMLILGNHDRRKSVSAFYNYGFNEVYAYPVVYGNIIFSHEPIIPLTGFINIHGHLHSNIHPHIKEWETHINCSIELWDYKPVVLDELLKIRRDKLENKNRDRNTPKNSK